MVSEIVNYIFPRRCPICESVIANGFICVKCTEKLPYIKGATCQKCGKGIEVYEDELCFDCQKTKKTFKKGFPLFHYVDPMVECMYDFKYMNKREYKYFFVEKLMERYLGIFRQYKFDVIIPIPIHVKRLKKRGYNQAGLIANELGKSLGIPVDNHVLTRNQGTAPQKNLDDEERIKNLIKAFNCCDLGVRYNKVLIVDDIYTTGATIEACTKLLLYNGVKEVYYTSICIGKGQ